MHPGLSIILIVANDSIVVVLNGHGK